MSAKNLLDYDDRGNPRTPVNTTCIVQNNQILITRYRISGDAILLDSVRDTEGNFCQEANLPAILTHIRHERNLYR